MTTLVPLADIDNGIAFWPGTGPQPPQDRLTSAIFYIVTPDYPSVMQLPFRRGRFFDDRDDPRAPRAAVIDEVMAGHLFPKQNPIGR
jgi:hypothetical protein